MRTYSTCDVILVVFALLVCAGGYRLGFGKFSDPGAGFMPLLSGLLLGVLALADLISGALTRWREDKKDGELWANIHWGRLFTTVGAVVLYLIVMPRIGFSVPTVLLLLVLFRVIEHRPWWFVTLLSLVTTLVFYLGFRLALGVDLPTGILGF